MNADKHLTQTKTDPGAPAWYWSRSEDDWSPLNGPFSTREEAVDNWLQEEGDYLRIELEAEGEVPLPISDETLRSMCPHVDTFRKPGISCEIFDADLIIEEWEEHNEYAAWPEAPLEMSPSLKRALEMHLAAALYIFAEQNGLWAEFRGLELCANQ